MLNNSKSRNADGDTQANNPNLIERYRVTPFQASGPTVDTQGGGASAGFYGDYANFYKVNGSYTEQGMLNGGSYLNAYGNDSASVYQGPTYNVVGQRKTSGKVSTAPKEVKDNADGGVYGYGYYPERSLNAHGESYMNAAAAQYANQGHDGYLNAGGQGIRGFFGNLFPNRQNTIDAKNAQKIADANMTNALAQALNKPDEPKSSALPWILGGSALAAAAIIIIVVAKRKKAKKA